MRILGIMFLFLLSFTVQAQKTISGRVLSYESKQPVSGASVYLSNTSSGTTTNDNGEFTLEKIPVGQFNLVVVSLAYGTYTQTLESSKLPPYLLIELKPHAQELQEVIVGGSDKGGWQKWGKIFRENFIGTSAFASNCEIKNPQVLRFHYSERKQELQVFSTEKLVIENKSLGYIVDYKLEDFRINFAENSVIYFGYPFFTEMPVTQPTQSKRWQSNRDEAYYGSMMHFMRSLLANRVAADGFQIRRVKQATKEEYERIQLLYPNAHAQALKLNALPSQSLKDSLYYYDRVLNTERGSYVLFDSLLQKNNLIRQVDSESGILQFRDYLEIHYTRKDEPREYLKYLPARQVLSGTRLSKLFLRNTTGVIVYSSGSYFPVQDLVALQFWAWWEKAANMLPLDYVSASEDSTKK